MRAIRHCKKATLAGYMGQSHWGCLNTTSHRRTPKSQSCYQGLYIQSQGHGQKIFEAKAKADFFSRPRPHNYFVLCFCSIFHFFRCRQREATIFDSNCCLTLPATTHGKKTGTMCVSMRCPNTHTETLMRQSCDNLCCLDIAYLPYYCLF